MSDEKKESSQRSSPPVSSLISHHSSLKKGPQGNPWPFLPPDQRKAVLHLGFSAPTPVQAAALPRALAGESFRALAPTGTGKTLVYLLAAWQALEEKAPPRRPAPARGRRGAAALVLVPTRELAYQASQMLQELSPALRGEAVVAVGGHAKRDQDHEAAGSRLVIATPGRLLDHLRGGTLSLRPLRLLVLDEFDKLIGMGFEEQIAEVLKQAPAGCQKLLLSATDQEAGAAEALGLGDLPAIAAARAEGGPTLTEQFYFLKSAKKKQALLLDELARTRGRPWFS